MFLKRLAIRGFKSFADQTVFEFTPGVAVIVGPNGSGKSNLVDAIAWVLGEQGAKTLRGGSMEDVIFAGTPKRPSLGRAEVSLTIDNSSQILPIEFAEVTISRTLTRAGDSTYALNGAPVRLLDVQELLSDSGIGRELHTIVGQGQLDDILAGRPEDRRAVVEEAAGLLKHRKRKEKAVRKLERVDADLERLQDVINELRRQIRPLERQAELAKRASEIEAELTDVRLKLWVLEYRSVAGEVDADAERRALAEVDRYAAAASSARARVDELEQALERATRDAAATLQQEYRLGGLRDRFEALRHFAVERRTHLDDLLAREPRADAPTPSEIEAARAAAAEAREILTRAQEDARRADDDRSAAATARDAAAYARETVVRLHGELATLRAAVDGAHEERARILERRGDLQSQIDRTAGDADEIRAELGRLEDEEAALGERLADAEARRDAAIAVQATIAGRAREIERRVDALRARRALVDEVSRSAGDDLNLEGIAGIGGRLAHELEVEQGYEIAVRAALGPLADAMVAHSREHATLAVEALKERGGRALFAVPGGASAPVPNGVRSILDVVRSSDAVVRDALAGVALAPSMHEALDLSAAHPSLTIVTVEGDVVAPRVIGGGEAELARDPRDELRALDTDIAEAEDEASAISQELASATGVLEAAVAAVEPLELETDALDVRLRTAAESLGRLEVTSQSLVREDTMLAGRLGEVAERAEADTERLRNAETRLQEATASGDDSDPAALAALERRAAEHSLRLGQATERERASAAALADLERRAVNAQAERDQYASNRARWQAQVQRAAAVAVAAGTLAARTAGWAEQARVTREGGDTHRAAIEAELAEVRRARREAETTLEEARQRAHETDLRRAERSHRLAGLETRVREEHGMAPGEALEAVTADPAEQEELAKRGTTLRRRLDLLGRVNPIAMEQHQGMVDRHAFLTEQVADLRASRRDLMSVVTEVDEKIEEIFSQAFADISREFEETFARLFPGGEGKLSLSNPNDLLNSGIEIEARPAGKKIKRVSLLSGGERALTAVALLFSVFRARPSPFYLLDEVEAALDDVNLHRFLGIAQEFKRTSQLLIVTHQKRTMQIADALYGISMGKSGTSQVICEKLGDTITEPVVVV